MLTIQALEEYGANVKEGLQRCMGKEDFYLRLVGMALADGGFAKLGEAIEEKDYKKGFEAAHALKGILSNLSLTPILDPVVEITELLRAGTETDYAPLYARIMEQYNKLKQLSA